MKRVIKMQKRGKIMDVLYMWKNVWLRAPWLFVGKWCSIGCLSLRAILVYMREMCVQANVCMNGGAAAVWRKGRMQIKWIESTHTLSPPLLLWCARLLLVRFTHIIYWMNRPHSHSHKILHTTYTKLRHTWVSVKIVEIRSRKTKQQHQRWVGSQ